MVECGARRHARRGSANLCIIIAFSCSGLKKQQEESETLAGSRSAGVRTEREDDSLNSLFYLPLFGRESIPPAAEFTVEETGKDKFSSLKKVAKVNPMVNVSGSLLCSTS